MDHGDINSHAVTGKGGRLLRGTASRLWGAVPAGLRQVRFQDTLSRGGPAEPAPGTARDGTGLGVPPGRPRTWRPRAGRWHPGGGDRNSPRRPGCGWRDRCLWRGRGNGAESP
uniref:Uncharacterized protein n=1 Tax=Nothoprocta perdicaria TaxID=30464 RepID=A0A8C6YNV1_NOTPE